jgi:digeranylgeranylglycerophospholipid reductase
MNISIIGGGPVGFHAAYELAKEGNKVTVHEEHSKIGRPVHCTGIVTADLKDIVPVKGCVINTLKRARIHAGPSEIELPIDDIVLDRAAFDRTLAERIEPYCTIELGKRMTELPTADIVIGADGSNSMVRRILNPDYAPHFYIGKQAIVKGSFERDVYEVHLGSVAPQFFAWIVPEDETTARIGLAAQANTDALFQKFIEPLNVRPVEYQGGLIPVFDPRLKIASRNHFLVGDAALQVKATTGGGLVPGLKSAAVLAKAINTGASYPTLWKRTVGKELVSHLMLRRILNKFTDEDYGDLIDLLQKDGVTESFRKHSRDKSLRLGASLLMRQPRLLSYVRKLF